MVGAGPGVLEEDAIMELEVGAVVEADSVGATTPYE